MQTIQRQLRQDGTCVLTFDRPDSAANIFDRQTLEELDAHLKAIAEPGLGARGLILYSAKAAVFIAGADLHAIEKMSPAEVGGFIELGQNAFARLAALTIPTVAAIHGAAVGGGCEIALACDWRVASPDKATKIGLPETQLGILPAWGGSTRLAPLIGLPAALDIILAGKSLAAKAALKRGLVDALAPHDHLLEAAEGLLNKGKRPRHWTHSPTMLKLAGAVAAKKARSEVLKKTRGHYPAVEKALDVVLKASTTSDAAEARGAERDAILELAGTPIAKNLLRLFFLSERARKHAVVSGAKSTPLDTAAVIGAGVMGSGIAQLLSARGLRVFLRDVDATRVAAGMANISKLYATGVKRHAFTALEARQGLDRVSPAPLEIPLKRCDLVIEAAVEKMDIKKTIFRRLDELVREDCILATNTSALSITELAAATQHPRRVVGVHFFNPVHQMQLVEVIVGKETAPEAAQSAVRFAQRIGKLPVVVKDSPGFLVNRILLPYMLEAAHLFWAGSDLATIDNTMLDFGMPMGPLRLTDEVGVDVAEDVARTLIAAFPDRLRMAEILPKLIEAGMLGKKTGKGFYVHKDKDAQPNSAAVGLRPRGGNKLPPDELQRRMTLLMVNEAARCVEEKVAESANDVDFAMVMGTGFAPFRGGPLRYADSLGLDKVAEDLTRLAGSAGAHFAPCALLAEKARNNQRFHED